MSEEITKSNSTIALVYLWKFASDMALSGCMCCTLGILLITADFMCVCLSAHHPLKGPHLHLAALSMGCSVYQ